MDEHPLETPKKLAAELFSVKGQGNIFMAVPCECGLRAADTLVIDGLTVKALREQQALALDLPDLSDNVREKLIALSQSEKKLAVGEFAVTGVSEAYYLRVEVVS